MSIKSQGITTPSVESGHATSAGTRLVNKAKLIKHDSLEREHFDLTAKVIWMINAYPGWSEDGTFTFPDGETWVKFDPEGEASEDQS
jgi:hypothetical protein